jgi:glycine hydroxymethyltransferase
MIQELPLDFLDTPLSEIGPEIAEELERQEGMLEMPGSTHRVRGIAPERGEWTLTIEAAERLAVSRACRIFGAERANVRPHSAIQANAAVYHALLEPGDAILGLELAHGGHFNGGRDVNVWGSSRDVITYHVDRESGLIDMDEVERIALDRRPRVILASWSAYPRTLDFRRFRAIADAAGAYLIVDMSHFAGLVAAGLYPNPVPLADVVTTTIYKTLGGARGGMILSTDRLAGRIASAVHAEQASGPLAREIAGKAVTLAIAASGAYREHQERAVAGAMAIADRMLAGSRGAGVLTGGTDVHLVLCDLRDSLVDGIGGEARLASIGLTASRLPMPFDTRPHVVSSGLRLGTQALASRGLQAKDFAEMGSIIADALDPYGFVDRHAALAERVAAIAGRYPLNGQPDDASPNQGVVLNFPRSPLPPAAAAAS